MNEIRMTPEFESWLSGLRDRKAKAAILARIVQAEGGNFGDTKPVGEGISEMRVFVGPGYRVYYVRIGNTVYLLLNGSDKTDQKRAIKQAKAMMEAMKR